MKGMEPAVADPALLAAFRQAVRARIRRDLQEEEAGAEALRARVVPRVEQAVVAAREAGLCRHAWLFGSFAWGRPGGRSDVDLLVEEGSPDEVAARVGLACGRMVHALALGEAPQSLREAVLSRGRPL